MHNRNLTNLIFSWAGFSAGRIVLTSLLLTILTGTVLLRLPMACTHPIGWFQAMFTAVSATCVTGLTVVPFADFSWFGKAVLMFLIQVGGLGLMTFSLFLTWHLAGGIGVAERLMASEILNFERLWRMKHFLTSVLLITFCVEIIGACCLLPKMLLFFPPLQACFYAYFYAISAFCNAGIAPNIDGLLIFKQDPVVAGILSVLIFAGSLGFPILYEAIEKFFALFDVKKFSENASHRWSLHSKIVLTTSLILTVGGGILFWLSPLIYNDWSVVLSLKSFFLALFHSSSLRNAGFIMQPIEFFSKPVLLISGLFMLIGSSPGSTGGGMKTSTLAVIIANIVATLRGRAQTTMFSRAIPLQQITKAFSIVFLGFCSLFLVTIALVITDPNIKFFHLFFEAISALSTTGITMGITEKLSMVGQAVLVVAMIAGRVGSLTFMFALRARQNRNLYKVPEERIFIG